MFKYLYHIFTSKNPNKIWIKIMIVFSILILLFILYKKLKKSAIHEGFSQKERFVLKRDSDAYDEFYVKIYDTLNVPGPRTDYEMKTIIDMTQASPKSTFLEVGSGTGHLVNKLQKAGYQAYGIDKSKAMVEQSKEQFPHIHSKCGDVAEPMAFDKNTFSHILCMNKNIYQFQDKVAFFRNCFHWLLPGGYLIIHLVDRDNFDPIVSAGKPKIFSASSPQQYSDKRINNTIIDFGDFKYKAEYDFKNKNRDITVFKETFTDKLSSNVRQNEQTLYMEDISDIIKSVQFSGFILQGKTDMENVPVTRDKHQYLYIFERPMS
jgi:SAM-dependent methyltransferase